MTPDKLLSPAEVAERLDTGKTFVYDLIASGRLPSRRLRRRRGRREVIRVAEADLVRYIESCIIPATPDVGPR